MRTCFAESVSLCNAANSADYSFSASFEVENSKVWHAAHSLVAAQVLIAHMHLPTQAKHATLSRDNKKCWRPGPGQEDDCYLTIETRRPLLFTAVVTQGSR